MEQNLTGRPRSTLRRRRGFTILELAVALGVFIVFAVTLTAATTSALGAQSTLRVRNNVHTALTRALDATVTNTTFDDLAAGVVTVPVAQRCPSDARRSCVDAGSVTIDVGYVVAVVYGPLLDSGVTVPVAVDVTGVVALPDGGELTVTRTVAAPHTGAGTDDGYVNVVISGDTAGFLAQDAADRVVRLVAGAGTGSETTVASTTVTSVDRNVIVVEAGDCAPTACTVVLDGGDYTMSDQFSTRGAVDVVVEAGRMVAATVQLTTGPALVVELATRPDRDGGTDGAPEAGSVCLWGTFDVDGVTTAQAWCNLTDPTRVTVRGYKDGETDVDLPAGPLTLFVNPPYENGLGDIVCTTAVSGMRRYSGGWQTGATCTGWTWGMPAVIASSATVETGFVEGSTTVTLQRSLTQNVTLYWEPTIGSPAAGCDAGDDTWAAPRTAPAPVDYDPDTDIPSC